MRRFVVLLLGAVCILFSGVSISAEDDFGVSAMFNRKEGVSQLEHYHSSADASFAICTLVRLSGKDLNGCIAAHKKVLRRLYDAALKTVKKPGARAALKEHLVQAVSRIEGIGPGVGEINIDYDRRQTSNDEKLKMAWTRFELEM